MSETMRPNPGAPRAETRTEPNPGVGAPRQTPPGGSKPPKKRVPWALIGFGVVLAGAIGYAVIPHNKTATGPGAAGGRGGPAGPGGAGRGGARGGAQAVSVNTDRVRTADVPIFLDALGTVVPTANVTVRPQATGQITDVHFKEGQNVRKGDLLVQIDPRPYQNALSQVEATLARDQATLANQRVTAQRYQTLLSQDSIARQTVDDQAAQMRSQEALVKADQANVATAQLNLSYTKVTAPVSGKVGLRLVDLGNYVTSGQANGLVVINEVTPIDVSFSLPEDNVRTVNARLRAGATLPADIFDRGSSTQLGSGNLLTLDNQIDTTTGTVKAKARFANADGGLFPNQFVNVKLQVDTLKDAIVVPSSAVLRGPNGLYVYKVGRSGAGQRGGQAGQFGQGQGGQRAGGQGGFGGAPAGGQAPARAGGQAQGGQQGQRGGQPGAAGAAGGGQTVTVQAIEIGQVSGTVTVVKSGLNVGDIVVIDGTDRLREGSRIQAPVCTPAVNRTGQRGGGQRAGGAQGGFGGGQAGAGQAARAPGGNATAQGGGQRAGGQAGGQRGGQGGGQGFARAGGAGGAGGCAPSGARPAGVAGAPGAPGGVTGDVGGNAALGANGGAPGERAGAGQGQGFRGQGGGQGQGQGGQGFGGVRAQNGQGGAQGQGGQGGQGRGAGGANGMFAQLDLTPAQMTKAQAIIAEARASGDPAAMRGAMTKVETVFTPAQKAKWEALRAQRGQGRGQGGGQGFGGRGQGGGAPAQQGAN